MRRAVAGERAVGHELLGRRRLGPRPPRPSGRSASASVWARRLATSRSWWSPTRVVGATEADEVARHQLGALVQQLEEGVLAVGAGLAPHDGPGAADAPAAPSSVDATCRCSPCRAAGGRPGSGAAPGCRAATAWAAGPEEVAVPDAAAGPCSTGRLRSSGAVPEVLVHGAHPGEQLGGSASAPIASMSDRPMAEPTASSARRPSPRTRTCWPGRCRRRRDLGGVGRHGDEVPGDGRLVAEAVDAASAGRSARWPSSRAS